MRIHNRMRPTTPHPQARVLKIALPCEHHAIAYMQTPTRVHSDHPPYALRCPQVRVVEIVVQLPAAKKWTWWNDASQGGGALGAIGSHLIDFLRFILDGCVYDLHPIS